MLHSCSATPKKWPLFVKSSSARVHHPLNFFHVGCCFNEVDVNWLLSMLATYVPLFSSVDECGFRLFLLSDEQFQRYVWNCGGGRIWLSFFRFQLLVKTHLVLALVNCQIESVQGNWSHISCLIAQLDLLPSQTRNGIAPRSNVDKVPGPFVVVCSSFVKCATNT